MGDGNFAVVRRSKQRDSDREFAIKIIDKSKMKVKKQSNLIFHYLLVCVFVLIILGKTIYA